MGVAPPPSVAVRRGTARALGLVLPTRRTGRMAARRAVVPGRFRLELAEPDRRVFIRQVPTLSPRGGMPVIVRER